MGGLLHGSFSLEDPNCLREILFLQDEEFLARVYGLILKREPDAEGRGTYLIRISLGWAKAELLADIVRSTEAREKGVDPRPILRQLRKFGLIKSFWDRLLGRLLSPSASLLERQLRVIEQRLCQLNRSITRIAAISPDHPLPVPERNAAAAAQTDAHDPALENNEPYLGLTSKVRRTTQELKAAIARHKAV
jgi:hypothetical protein